MMAPVRSLAEVQKLDAAELNVAALNRVCHSLGTECAVVFTRETERPESTVHVRMVAPLLGVPEDPVTGSTNGASGACLVRHRAVALSPPNTTIVSEQGAGIGRPSTVYVEVDHDEDAIRAVRVGGDVVAVMEGVTRIQWEHPKGATGGTSSSPPYHNHGLRHRSIGIQCERPGKPKE